MDMNMYIGGQYVPASDGGVRNVVCPTTGEIIGTVPSATREDVARAIANAVQGQKEWNAIPDELKQGEWLEVHHTSGDGLPPLYHRSSLGVIPVEKTAYSDVAVNIKYFEYMSYGLPVACTDARGVADLVERDQIGSVSADTPEAMAENIRSMFADPGQMARWAANARHAAETANLWNHRVRRMVDELSALRKKG